VCKHALLAVPVGISNRHVHLSQQHVEILFGQGYQLTKMKDQRQIGQFACNETVTVIGPKGILENVRVLGPARGETQIEVSLTDSFRLGITPPVRESGKLEDSPGCHLVGPKGAVTLSRGVIIAERHIHMSPKDAQLAGLRDNDRVTVLAGTVREVVFHHVLVRVHPSFNLEIHLDTDEANAAMVKNDELVYILSKEPSALHLAG